LTRTWTHATSVGIKYIYYVKNTNIETQMETARNGENVENIEWIMNMEIGGKDIRLRDANFWHVIK